MRAPPRPRHATALLVALALALHLAACASDTGPGTPAGALDPGDLNLIFVVSPDLDHQTPGDVSPVTGNLTPQGLQRSLLMAGYLKRQVLGGQNVTRIHALQPMTHLQTVGGYPDLAALTYVQPFAQLNTLSVPGNAGYNSPLLTAQSFPINTSAYDPSSGRASLPYQGLEFDGASANNAALIGTILAGGYPGFYVLSAPWETVQALLVALDARHSLGLAVPTTYAGSNVVYAVAVKPSHAATLVTFDAALAPAATAPALPAPVARAACPTAGSTPPLFQLEAPTAVAGAGLPPGINTNQTMYLIRHAEAHPYPGWEDGNYVAAGQWRALALPEALRVALQGRPSPTEVWSVDPAQVYLGTYRAAGLSNYSYVRPALTAAPYAIANDLPFRLVSDIEIFAAGSDAAMARRLFFDGAFSGTTTLLAWEHSHIPAIVTALIQAYDPQGGAPVVPGWLSADYDSIWTVRLDDSGRLTVDNALCEGIDSSKLPATAPAY